MLVLVRVLFLLPLVIGYPTDKNGQVMVQTVNNKSEMPRSMVMVVWVVAIIMMIH